MSYTRRVDRRWQSQCQLAGILRDVTVRCISSTWWKSWA